MRKQSIWQRSFNFFLLFCITAIVFLFWIGLLSVTNGFGLHEKLRPILSGSFLPVLIVSDVVLILGVCLVLDKAFGTSKPFEEYSREDAARLLDHFLSLDWNDADLFDLFTATKFSDPLIQQTAEELGSIQNKYPASGAYCSEEGYARIRELRDRLRSEKSSAGTTASSEPAS